MPRTRRWATITVALAGADGAVSIGLGAVTGAASPTSCVALGNSCTAGPVIPTQQPPRWGA